MYWQTHLRAQAWLMGALPLWGGGGGGLDKILLNSISTYL